MTLKFNSWLAVCISMFACAHLMSQEAGAATPRKAAIFVANHADKTLDDKLPALEDFISSRITGKGFSVISPEVATAAVSSLLKDSQQTEIDKALDNNSSALRLAQMLGADYIIMASISSYGTDKQTTQAYGVQYVTVTYTLRVTYKILEGVQGGTLAGGTFPVTSTKRFTENSRSEQSGHNQRPAGSSVGQNCRECGHKDDRGGRRILESGRVFRCVRYARPRSIACDRS